MRKNRLLLMGMIGLSACAEPVADAGLCIGLGPDVAELRRALEAHPQTPMPVGEAGADVVIGFEAGCKTGKTR